MIPRIHQAALKLRRPFVTGSLTMLERRVLLLELGEEGGNERYFGESAPLESFGTESYEESLAALEAAAAALEQMSADARSIRRLDKAVPALREAPCARFAVETALLDLLSRRRDGSLAGFLAGTDGATRCVPANAVLSADGLQEIEHRCAELTRGGFSCIKLKVGRGSIEADIEAVAAARRSTGSDTLIRLDANGAWTREQATAVLEAVAEFDIEYVEQPLPASDIEGLRSLAAASPIPIAADESAQSLTEARRLLKEDACDVFVLKPMAAGSLLACREFALQAMSAWKGIVFTSMIEGPVGREAAAHLAASIPGAQSKHHGLATGMLFEHRSAGDRVKGGVYYLQNGAGLGISSSEVYDHYVGYSATGP